MIRVTPFKQEHLKDFLPKMLILDLEQSMQDCLDSPERTVLTLKKKDEIICIAGINFLRLGVGEVWIIPSILVDVYKCEFYKTIYRLINNYVITQLGLHRVTMAIEVGWSKGVKWAETLGFSREGIMKAYDHNRVDHYLYAKVVE